MPPRSSRHRRAKFTSNGDYYDMNPFPISRLCPSDRASADSDVGETRGASFRIKRKLVGLAASVTTLQLCTWDINGADVGTRGSSENIEWVIIERAGEHRCGSVNAVSES